MKPSSTAEKNARVENQESGVLEPPDLAAQLHIPDNVSVVRFDKINDPTVTMGFKADACPWKGEGSG